MDQQMPSLRLLVAAALAAPIVAAAGTAEAVTGYVSGSVSLWNKNGNYCPTNADCTGARYPQSDYDKWQPLSNAVVRIYNSGGTQIGQGSTSTAGTFTASWTASTRPAQIRLRFLATHKDNRFWLAQTDGLLYNWFTSLITTAATSTSSSPQALGTSFLGSASVPDPYANVYWAMEREWRTIFNLVGVLQNNFTNVEVRGFADDIPSFLGLAPTSMAQGPTKRVQLSLDAPFAPMGRAMHEMGHIASYVTHPWQITGNYNWPNTTGKDGWGPNTAEWSVSAFEEAFATHYANLAFWWANSVKPTTCITALTCYESGGAPSAATDIEATSFSSTTNNCSTASANPESRWPLSAMRFIWDTFDNRDDGKDSYSADAGAFWAHLAIAAFYPEGTSANQIDEPWNSDRTAVTERDGRGAASYAANYKTNFANIDLLRTSNCSPR